MFIFNQNSDYPVKYTFLRVDVWNINQELYSVVLVWYTAFLFYGKTFSGNQIDNL